METKRWTLTDWLTKRGGFRVYQLGDWSYLESWNAGAALVKARAPVHRGEVRLWWRSRWRRWWRSRWRSRWRGWWKSRWRRRRQEEDKWSRHPNRMAGGKSGGGEWGGGVIWRRLTYGVELPRHAGSLAFVQGDERDGAPVGDVRHKLGPRQL